MRISYYLSISLIVLALLLEPSCPLKGFREESYPSKNITNCQKQCGDVKIEYPFGIGPNCSYDANFTLTCNSTASSPKPKPFLTSLNLELLEVRWSSFGYFGGELTVNNPIVKACCGANNNNNTTPNEVVWGSLDLRGSPFSFSSASSIVLISIGCRGRAMLYNVTGGKIGGCSSTCDRVMDGCYGYHCCQSLIDYEKMYDMKRYSISVSAMPGSCRVAFLSNLDFLNANNATVDAAIARSLLVPFVLDWSITHEYVYEVINSPVTAATVLREIKYSMVYVGPVVGTLLLSCCCFWSCWFCKTKKRRKEIRLRAKYFKGRLKQCSSDKEVVEKTKLFTISELKKATDNFNGNRILGQGGQGTVYKGMLTNEKVIAIKRSKTFEEKEWKQFINEVILLSQVSHKNIVKLLGCCLETKLPLLVYEFVSNGTLSQHINNPTAEYLLSWEMRVRIATEIAGAIAYLHSSSSTPIYHRDIKSTNILLDHQFQAKVSDFGISKAIVANQTHLTTCVQGTFGYLDPEYFRSSRFSEKSDVYSFGVILVELLTGQQPIRITDVEEEKSLVLYFITSMNKASLEEILDPIVLEGTSIEEIMVMACLAIQCLKPRGIERPTMKEVAVELESLRKKSSSKISSLEIENFETGSTLEMGNAYTCPIMHNSSSAIPYNFDDEQPMFAVTW